MLTSSTFFNNQFYETGNHNCFYCGASCSEKYTTKEYVKETFTNRDIVYRPSSKFVCGGCVASFQEKTTITLINGETRDGQRIRQYSWFITKEKATPFTKAHIHLVREIITNPPEPPFAFIFAESGQKHLIFRSKIALDKENFVVMLEEQYINVNVSLLKEILAFLIKPISCFGKIGILEEPSIGGLGLLFEKFQKEAEYIVERLNKIRTLPITKLAVWLSPNKEDCTNLIKDNI